MPTIVLVDVSLSVLLQAATEDKSLQRKDLIQRGVLHFLNYLEKEHPLEEVALMTFSSKCRTVVPFTNDLSHLRRELYNIEAEDRSDLTGALGTVFEYAKTVPPSAGVCNVVVVTDGRPATPYSLLPSEDNKTGSAPPQPLNTRVHAIAFGTAEECEHEVFEFLCNRGPGGHFTFVEPRRDSTIALLRRSFDSIMQTYYQVQRLDVVLGDFGSIQAQLHPQLMHDMLGQRLAELGYEGLSVPPRLAVGGFLAMSDFPFPPAMSDHALIAPQETMSDESKTTHAALYKVLSQENLYAVCPISRVWHALIYADDVIRGLRLCILEPNAKMSEFGALSDLVLAGAAPGPTDSCLVGPGGLLHVPSMRELSSIRQPAPMRVVSPEVNRPWRVSRLKERGTAAMEYLKALPLTVLLHAASRSDAAVVELEVRRYKLDEGALTRAAIGEVLAHRRRGNGEPAIGDKGSSAHAAPSTVAPASSTASPKEGSPISQARTTLVSVKRTGLVQRKVVASASPPAAKRSPVVDRTLSSTNANEGPVRSFLASKPSESGLNPASDKDERLASALDPATTSTSTASVALHAARAERSSSIGLPNTTRSSDPTSHENDTVPQASLHESVDLIAPAGNAADSADAKQRREAASSGSQRTDQPPSSSPTKRRRISVSMLASDNLRKHDSSVQRAPNQHKLTLSNPQGDVSGHGKEPPRETQRTSTHSPLTVPSVPSGETASNGLAEETDSAKVGASEDASRMYPDVEVPAARNTFMSASGPRHAEAARAAVPQSTTIAGGTQEASGNLHFGVNDP